MYTETIETNKKEILFRIKEIRQRGIELRSAKRTTEIGEAITRNMNILENSLDSIYKEIDKI